MFATKLAVFSLTLSLGIWISAIVRYETTTLQEELTAAQHLENHECHNTFSDRLNAHCRKESDVRLGGDGYSGGSGSSSGSDTVNPAKTSDHAPGTLATRPLKILAKKKAEYTDAARTNGTQGTVTLRVTFLASGGIGAITTVKGLRDGLTEKAIEAARHITFEPEYRNGVRKTTSRPVSYTFNIY